MSNTTVTTLQEMKRKGEKIAMLSVYDYPTARFADAEGIEVLLVGDSVATALLGYETTLPMTMDGMIHHVAAVVRGATNALVVADMPFMSYQASPQQAAENAGRFIQKAGAAAVKLEGGSPSIPAIEAILHCGIPVMGHLGLTPQSIHQFGGYRVQGRGDAADKLLQEAQAIEQAGIFALVLECMSSEAAQRITEALTIPTIGIGAGPHCDGQVLVGLDVLGINPNFSPKFVKKYANLHEIISTAFRKYREEVRSGEFPSQSESYD